MEEVTESGDPVVAAKRLDAAVIGIMAVGQIDLSRPADLSRKIADPRERSRGDPDGLPEIDVLFHQPVQNT